MQLDKKYHDEEDNWSISSSYPHIQILFTFSHCKLFTPHLWLEWSLAIFSVATSVKSRVTVGVAPTFRSASRAERRKEVT